MKPRNEDDLRITEEAAEWLYRLNQRDADSSRAAFLAWLKRSPRHMQEFLMMTAVSRELDGIDPEREIDVRAWIVEPPTNVVPLREAGVESDVSSPQAERWDNRNAIPRAGIAAAVALAATGAIALWQFSVPTTYSTAVGEQRTVKLEDGSMMYLNTRSRAQVDYTEHARYVRLQDGEALFVVTHDTHRPFRVAAGSAVVRALGTQFNVRARDAETWVSVVEGRVQVSTGSEVPVSAGSGAERVSTAGAGQARRSPEAVQLGAGEEVRVARDGVILERAVGDVAKTVAWRQRRLVFRDDGLADIVAEFNRYNRAPQFRIAGDEVGARRYTGTFDADDPASLEALLAKEEDLMLERDGNEIWIRSRLLRSPSL